MLPIVFFCIISRILKICNCYCNNDENVTGGAFTDGTYMDSYVIRAHSGTGPKMCIRDCLLQSDCNAVNFKKADWTCELLSISGGDQSTVQADFFYSSITGWTMVRLYFYELYGKKCKEFMEYKRYYRLTEAQFQVIRIDSHELIRISLIRN